MAIIIHSNSPGADVADMAGIEDVKTKEDR